MIPILYALLYLAGAILIVYLVLWILGLLGINIPDNIRKVIFAIFIIVALIWIVSNLWPSFGFHHLR